jgi:hypothetical protein
MRQVSLVIAVALLGTAVDGCADPHRPRSDYAYQSYPSGYTVYQTAPVQVAYVSYPATYTTYPASYSTYRSYDYDRNYMGIHPGPELRTFP